MAESVLSASPANPVPLIGFGGTHYAARETEIALTSRGAFGHIAHTREIATLDEEMIRAMMEKSGAVAAYIDRKALDREDLGNLASLLKRLCDPPAVRKRDHGTGTSVVGYVPGSAGDGRTGLSGCPVLHP